MPEIAEIARIVHFLRARIVGRTVATVSAQDDSNIFGKVGTSAADFQSALTGKKVVGAGQQGKYFWLEMESPPHPLIHFGMTGWLHLKDQYTYYHPPSTEIDDSEPQSWPPKFTKFTFTTADNPVVEAAFTDPRRFGRVRLINCDGASIRTVSPLKENGPDPVIDSSILTQEWLAAKLNKRHVPIKALLLDQAVMSGVGNWVGDEVLYHARIHPEQYSDTLGAAQVKTLHHSLMYVTKTAVELLGDASKFPEEWLFRHRWSKGRKGDGAGKMPGGEKIVWLTVGGRTSAVVPSRQKKTGAVAGDMKDEETNDEDVGKENLKSAGKEKGKVKKRKVEAAEANGVAKKFKSGSKVKESKVKEEGEAKNEPDPELMQNSDLQDAKPTSTPSNTKVKRTPAIPEVNSIEDGRRRSGRARK